MHDIYSCIMNFYAMRQFYLKSRFLLEFFVVLVHCKKKLDKTEMILADHGVLKENPICSKTSKMHTPLIRQKKPNGLSEICNRNFSKMHHFWELFFFLTVTKQEYAVWTIWTVKNAISVCKYSDLPNNCAANIFIFRGKTPTYTT